MLRLAARRMLAHAALFVALLGIVGVVAGFSVGIAGYVSAASLTGVREGFAAATGSEGAVRAQVRLGSSDQDSAVRAQIARLFGDAPLIVERTLATDPLTATFDGERDSPVVVASVQVEGRAELATGRWAEDEGEAALDAGTAASLGVGAGDAFTLIGGQRMVVVGTWIALDPLDPYWFGDDLSRTLLVQEEEFERLEVVPFARWTVRPDPGLVRPVHLDAISAGAEGLEGALGDDDTVGSGNVIYDGGLAAWTDTLRASLSAVAGVVPVPALLSAAIGLVALVELARLLVGVRVIETSLLRSRGASAARLTRDAAFEALVAAVPGAALGTGVAIVAVGPDALVDVWPIPVIAVAAAVAAFAATAFLDARRPASRETAQDSGRGRRIVGAGLVVLVVAAAAISVWQFRLYGSPVVRGPGGRSIVDPIAVLAPALALVACALLVVVAFTAGSTALDRAIRRRGTVDLALAVRQIARRAAVFTTPVLLVALATGGLTVAAVYSATWQNATESAREVGNGAAARAITSDPATSFAALGEVDAAAPVLAVGLRLGDDPVALIAIDADSALAVVDSARGAIDVTKIADAIRVDTAGLALPDGTRELAVEATSPTSVWLADEQGAVTLVRDDGPLPAGSGWRILALDVPISATGAEFAYRLTSIEADGAPVELGEWVIAAEAHPLEGSAVEADDGAGFTASVERPLPGTVRLVRAPADEQRLPLVVSESLAARASLSAGDPLTLRLEGSGREITGEVRLVVPAVPGTSNGLGVVADLTAVERQQLLFSGSALDSTEVWIATDDPAAIPGARVTTVLEGQGEALLGAGRAALWIGAIGGLLLAAGAVSAVAGALLRARTGELVVLRAVGLSAAQQAGSRRDELLLVLSFSVLAGILSGAIVSALVIGQLARSAVLDPPAALPTVLALDVPWALVALIGFVLSLLTVTLVYAARVRGQARTLSAREDVR